MFRMSPCTVHTWQDLMRNIGKLSLAGLFLGGTLFLAHANAATISMQSTHSVTRLEAVHPRP
jgi:hypothetical protein